jgi:hypothetical protein
LRNLAGRVEHHAVPSFPGDPEYKENTKLHATDARLESEGELHAAEDVSDGDGQTQ